MKFISDNTRQVIDLTSDELDKLSYDQLCNISPLDESDNEVVNAYTDMIEKYNDVMKAQPYYSKDDRINDSDGFLHEDYLDRYNLESLNEQNLLRYNHINVEIFNELMDIKYDEVGGRDVITTPYVLDNWIEYCAAKTSVSYGYDQKDIYKDLCAAFGKMNVDQVWYKYYR